MIPSTSGANVSSPRLLLFVAISVPPVSPSATLSYLDRPRTALIIFGADRLACAGVGPQPPSVVGANLAAPIPQISPSPIFTSLSRAGRLCRTSRNWPRSRRNDRPPPRKPRNPYPPSGTAVPSSRRRWITPKTRGTRPTCIETTTTGPNGHGRTAMTCLAQPALQTATFTARAHKRRQYPAGQPRHLPPVRQLRALALSPKLPVAGDSLMAMRLQLAGSMNQRQILLPRSAGSPAAHPFGSRAVAYPLHRNWHPHWHRHRH